MIFFILSLLCGCVHAASPSKDDKLVRILNQKMPEIGMANGDAFASLCLQLEIPCGEELPSESFVQIEDEWFRPEDITVQTLLDKIASGRHGGLGYFWEISDGVLLLRPLTPHVASPLDNRVHLFVRKDEPLSSIIHDMGKLEWMREPGPKMTAGHVPSIEAAKLSEEKAAKRIGINCLDLTVREILNMAVRTHGHGMWIYTYASPSRIMPNFTRRGMLDFFTY